jgi:hypothetical protein
LYILIVENNILIHTREVTVCVVDITVVVEGVVVDDHAGFQIVNLQKRVSVKRKDQLLGNQDFFSKYLTIICRTFHSTILISSTHTF